MIRGLVYFGLVFGVGLVLGTARVLWLEPQVGARIAELLETPLMLAAMFVAAGFVLRRFPAQRRLDYLVSGLVALVLLLSVEFTVVLALRGLTIGEYFAELDPVAGPVYFVMLLVFAVMPWLLGGAAANNERRPEGPAG